MQGDARIDLPGDVVDGTYQVWAEFLDDRTVRAGSITVTGADVSLSCSSYMFTCVQR